MSIQPLLIAAAALFSIGIYGILVRRNAVMVLLSIELILNSCLLYTSPSPRDRNVSRMPSSA